MIKTSKVLLLIFVFLGMSIVLSGCGNNGSINPFGSSETIEDAIAYYETGAYDKAENIFSQGDISNLSLSGLWYRGKTAMELGKYSEAVDTFRNLTRIEPTDQNFTELGLAYYRLGNIEEADGAFTQALRVNSENTRALMNKGVLLADSGELQTGLRFLETANRLDPKNPTILYNMATIYSDLSYEEQAIQSPGSALYAQKTLTTLDLVLELDPSMSEAYIYKGITLFESEKFESAINHLEQGLKLDENNISALYYLGNSYKQIGDLNKAENAFDRLLLIQPENQQAIRAKNTLRE